MSARLAPVLAALMLCACASAQPAQPRNGVLLPGVLDIQVRASDSIPDDCYFDPPTANTGPRGCVEFSMRDGPRAAHAYNTAIESRGWTQVGGDERGTALFFNKPTSEACAQRLRMEGGEQANAMEHAAARASRTEHLLDIGQFTFTLENELRCGARRDEP
jgi:hypothetical protein